MIKLFPLTSKLSRIQPQQLHVGLFRLCKSFPDDFRNLSSPLTSDPPPHKQYTSVIVTLDGTLKSKEKKASTTATEVWLTGFMAPLIHANQLEGQMPVSVTMRPIQPSQYCYSQCGSSTQVTQTKPGLLLHVCVYVCTHVWVYRSWELERETLWWEGGKGGKRICESLWKQESKQMERVQLKDRTVLTLTGPQSYW